MRTLLFAILTLFSVAAMAAQPEVELQTNRGNITVELYPGKAPKTVANFLQYVRDGFYDGTVFHRVISGFMIQGGGFDKNSHRKETRAPIPLESGNGLHNDRGTLAMARTSDPNSATSQFFINLVDNSFLDKANARDGEGYAVFGKVIKGMKVVDKIAASKTHAGRAGGNMPDKPVIIQHAKVLKTSS